MRRFRALNPFSVNTYGILVYRVRNCGKLHHGLCCMILRTDLCVYSRGRSHVKQFMLISLDIVAAIIRIA